MSKATLWDRYRRDLVSPAGFVVFVAGNKRDTNGAIVAADGVRAEYELAREFGKYPLPVGATGWVAKDVWQEVMDDFDVVFPPKTSRRDFRKLGSPVASNVEIVDALFRLIKSLTPRRN
jgi:hypothetical protein